MSELEPRSSPSSLEATALALLLATGFASPPLLVVGASFGVLHPVCALLGLCGAGLIATGIYGAYKLGEPDYSRSILPTILLFALARADLALAQSPRLPSPEVQVAL